MMEMSNVLYDLYDEYVARGAWMAHAYGFENMREYYEPISDYMKENGLDSSQVDSAYEDVNREYNAVASDPDRSFMNPDDTSHLDHLDDVFLNELANAAQMTADKLNMKDIWF